jgi:glutamate--cysteine ligase
MDWDGRDERKYLHALWEIAKSGITPADEKLARFQGEWRGSVDPVFSGYAY